VNPTAPALPIQAAQLDAAYAECRAISRREAKNFYYAFVALPEPRRNAICAIYAFMRKADDLADDETLSISERRRSLDAWTSAWRAASTGSETADPVFLAVRDATQRFNIPLSLLDELVAGVTMDLDATQTDAPDTYATFDDLYRYCYLVASVVGLVCIRIFGYTDRRADQLAIDTGIAFQLTNILRDIKEDADRGRIYLPADMLREYAVTPERILALAAGAQPATHEIALLAALELHAQTLYRSSAKLIPLLDADARPSMRVLVRIYHRLLDRIAENSAAVFTQRVSVPTSTKLAILFLGILQSFKARIMG